MGYIYEALGETEQAGQSYEKAVKAQAGPAPGDPRPGRFLCPQPAIINSAAPLIERLLSGEVQASESDLVSARRMKAEHLGHAGLFQTQGGHRAHRSQPGLAAGRPPGQTPQGPPPAGRSPPGPRPRSARIGGKPGGDRRGGARPRRSLPIGPAVSGPRRLGTLPGADGKARQRQPVQSALSGGLRPHALGSGPTGRRRAVCSIGWIAFPIRGRRSPSAPNCCIARRNGARCPTSSTPMSARKRPNPRIRSTASSSPPNSSNSWAASRPRPEGTAGSYFEKARQWIESCVRKRPGTEMLLAGFDARRGKVEDALQEIERYGEKSRPQEVFAVVGAVVSRPDAKPAQLNRLETLIVALLDKDPAARHPSWWPWRKSNRPWAGPRIRRRSIARSSAKIPATTWPAIT